MFDLSRPVDIPSNNNDHDDDNDDGDCDDDEMPLPQNSVEPLIFCRMWNVVWKHWVTIFLLSVYLFDFVNYIQMQIGNVCLSLGLHRKQLATELIRHIQIND